MRSNQYYPAEHIRTILVKLAQALDPEYEINEEAITDIELKLENGESKILVHNFSGVTNCTFCISKQGESIAFSKTAIFDAAVKKIQPGLCLDNIVYGVTPTVAMVQERKKQRTTFMKAAARAEAREVWVGSKLSLTADEKNLLQARMLSGVNSLLNATSHSDNSSSHSAEEFEDTSDDRFPGFEFFNSGSGSGSESEDDLLDEDSSDEASFEFKS